MKKMVVVIFIFLTGFLYGQNYINETFYSPNRINKIEYEGTNRSGLGNFYKDYRHIDNKILSVELHVTGPQIYWHGDYIVEIYVYYGPGFHDSYFYLFEYNKLTPIIKQVIFVIPNMEIIFNTDDWVNINIRSLVSNLTLQNIKLEGINGIVLGSKNLFNNVEITEGEILLRTDVEPYTYKTLENPILYRFRRMF
jgi:hypothetical protein